MAEPRVFEHGDPPGHQLGTIRLVAGRSGQSHKPGRPHPFLSDFGQQNAFHMKEGHLHAAILVPIGPPHDARRARRIAHPDY
ncbi:hypothetical protein [Paracoccus sp. (in: a-proteobacteria)]|uniref:hypothetical protein n=1 Tax=Paracoccus sp. TaxID=267 RepID=UPI0026DFBE6E|nr:hypothetical protein [Paracoccus sp. (in: a-proteobacteria)]MDO5648784.1 hypothetical protein [Paracoccus sp. (in: a-proteobacteria)]